jgi:hypothetical protein
MTTLFPFSQGKPKRRKILSLEEVESLIAQADAEVKSTSTDKY